MYKYIEWEEEIYRITTNNRSDYKWYGKKVVGTSGREEIFFNKIQNCHRVIEDDREIYLLLKDEAENERDFEDVCRYNIPNDTLYDMHGEIYKEGNWRR